MLHTMTSGGPFRNNWVTPYNSPFFHPNYSFPIFHNPLSYSFSPNSGSFFTPTFDQTYTQSAENRHPVIFETSSPGEVYLPPPCPYNMQVPGVSNPFMDQGYLNAELSSRYLENQSMNFNFNSGSDQGSVSIPTDNIQRNTYGNESTDGIHMQRKRKQELPVMESWNNVAQISTPGRRTGSSNGAIDLSLSTGIKRQRLSSCFAACDSGPVMLKVNNEGTSGSERHNCTQKSLVPLNSPSSSYMGTLTFGNIAQERQNMQTEIVSVKNESWDKPPLPLPSHTPFLPPTSLHDTEMFAQRGLDLMPGCSRVWTSSSAETNANRPFIPDILNIPFNPFFPPLVPNTNMRMNWLMERHFSPYIPVTANSSSTFDFANPLGIKREELAPTAAVSSSSLDVSAAERRTDDLVHSTQPDSTSTETTDREPKPEVLVPVSSCETEKHDTEKSIKLEDIIITRPAEEPKLQDSQRPQMMRNWLLENLERGLKKEASFRISRRRHFDIRGLQLLSRGIEKIERHSGKGRLTGLGLLCALAEERMKDDIGVSDEDSWENNSVETEITDSEDTRLEVEIGHGDDEELVKPMKIKHRRDGFYCTPAREEDTYAEVKISEDSDSGPPLLTKVDDLPVWNTDDRNRPPTLSPKGEEQGTASRCDVETSISSVKRNKDDGTSDKEEERLNEEVKNNERKSSEEILNIKKEKETMNDELAECSTSRMEIAPRSSSDKGKERERVKKMQKRRAKSADCSTYNFRPADPNNSWIKEEVDENSQEQVSSFEIVRTEVFDSSSDTMSYQLWKKDESEADCSGENASELSTKDNKRQGKLILRLRRERLNRSEEDDQRPKNCLLTTEGLMTSKFPVKILTMDTGLFYTGQLSAIRPPDVYGITIDGERGNRPHIYSREEVLNNSFLEVKPMGKKDLPPGTRVCAYWSEQCRCLYPGSVSASSIIDPDPNSVNIEFDDGDSCRISITNIRLLPENYPITECSPNPLTNLGKKKRRINTKEDVVCQNLEKVPEIPDAAVMTKKQDPETEASSSKTSETEYNLLKTKKKNHNRSPSDRGKHKKKHKHHHRRKKRGEPVAEGASSGRKKQRAKRNGTSTRSQRSGTVPARKPWGWSGKGFRRPGIKGKARKEYFRAIQRGNEKIVIGECAVFLSSGRPDRPFIGRIESMWETWGANMVVRVKWFYHPEETVGCPATLEYPGALFESPHSDENDVQTISHKCEVLPLKRYIEKLGKGAKTHEGNTKLYYLAGFYDPTNTSLQFQEGVK